MNNLKIGNRKPDHDKINLKKLYYERVITNSWYATVVIIITNQNVFILSFNVQLILITNYDYFGLVSK